MSPDSVLSFWFEELQPKQWWSKDDALDKAIADKFLDVHHKAIVGELWSWRKTPRGRLAEIIILDQFSRNIYRNRPQAFAYDPMALILAQEAVTAGALDELTVQKQPFVILPYMHSESLKIHEEAVELFDRKGLEESFQFELKHKIIIERFGRYPHRNEILGRESTAEEIEFLQGPDSSF